VAPADVEEVVADAEDGDGLEGEDGGDIGCELVGVLVMFRSTLKGEGLDV
jgi:hypothetical protein